MNEINPGTAEHPHRQIAESLRARIRAGEWVAGERIPSIPALAEAYGVAKQTVQRTIDAAAGRRAADHPTRLGHLRPGHPPPAQPPLPGPVRRPPRLPRRPRRPVPAAAARGRTLAPRHPRWPTPSGCRPAPRWSAASTWCARTSSSRSSSARPGSWPAEADGTSLARELAFGRPLYQEVEEVTGRRYASAADHITARLPTREEATHTADPTGHAGAASAARRLRRCRQTDRGGPGDLARSDDHADCESYRVPADDASTTVDGPDLALA